jgi:glycosyltransferase involved in cell wall biosynthesis
MPHVVIPVLNEAAALPSLLAAMPPGYTAVVADNGSTDGSGDIARSLGAVVVDAPVRGFGAACWAGTSDLVLGARRPTTAGAWPMHARMANRVLALELRRRTGYKLRDIGPMRAARRDALLALGIEDRRFGWPLEMVLRAAAAGWRIDELPVPYAPRSGRSKVTGTVAGTMRAVRDMSRVLATS